MKKRLEIINQMLIAADEMPVTTLENVTSKNVMIAMIMLDNIYKRFISERDWKFKNSSLEDLTGVPLSYLTIKASIAYSEKRSNRISKSDYEDQRSLYIQLLKYHLNPLTASFKTDDWPE